MRVSDLTPIKIALTYFLLGAVYILLSDWLVVGGREPGWRPGLETGKGLGFVIVSAALIGWLVRRELRRREAVIKAAEAAQRLEALGRLTAGVAHDFNNLLTVVINSAELLETDLADRPAQKRHASSILGAGERAAQLIQNLLVFARQHPTEPRLFEAGERIAALEPIIRQALGKRLSFVFSTGSAPLMLRSDPAQFDSALLNLALNARDAMPESGHLSINARQRWITPAQSAALQVTPGDYLEITVTDQGHGMTEETARRAFEPFFTTKEPDRGTGLGLSTIFGFMHENRGAITLDTAPGKGTKVTLILPMATDCNTLGR